ncbi:hypothetical protein AMTRI_Chr03g51580 [Amborella trichopoda]
MCFSSLISHFRFSPSFIIDKGPLRQRRPNQKPHGHGHVYFKLALKQGPIAKPEGPSCVGPSPNQKGHPTSSLYRRRPHRHGHPASRLHYGTRSVPGYEMLPF